jgi:hypothetical protein
MTKMTIMKMMTTTKTSSFHATTNLGRMHSWKRGVGDNYLLLILLTTDFDDDNEDSLRRDRRREGVAILRLIASTTMSMKITFWPHHKTLTMDFTLAALSSVVTYNNQLNGWPSAVDCNDDDNDGGNGDSDGNDNGKGDGDSEGNGGGTRCNK